MSFIQSVCSTSHEILLSEDIIIFSTSKLHIQTKWIWTFHIRPRKEKNVWSFFLFWSESGSCRTKIKKIFVLKTNVTNRKNWIDGWILRHLYYQLVDLSCSVCEKGYLRHKVRYRLVDRNYINKLIFSVLLKLSIGGAYAI